MNPDLEKQMAAADVVIEATGETQPGTETDTPAPKITLLWDEEMCARETPLPPPIIDGLLNRGEVSILAAKSKAGKSWLLLQAAKCVGAGVPFLGFPSIHGTCVYLNTEIADAAWEERCRRQNEALGIVAPCIAHASTRGEEITIRNVIPLLKEAIAAKGIEQVDLICIDPYYTLTAGLDENAAGEVTAAMLGFQKMAEKLKAAIWIAHHFAKGDAAGKAQLDRGSGSGVFARSVDNFFTLTEDGDKKIFEATRRNMKSPAPLELSWEYPIWRRLGEAAAIVPKRPGRRAVIDPVDIPKAFPTPDAFLTRADFLQHFSAVGQSAVDRALQRAQPGILQAVNGGYRLTHAFAELRRREIATSDETIRD